MAGTRLMTTATGGLRAALAAATLLVAGNSWATDFVVTSLADNTASDGEVTLREALMAASMNASVGDAPAGEEDGDRVAFDPDLLDLVAPTIRIDGNLGAFSIDDDVVIDGSVGLTGMVTLTVDAGGIQRAFNVDAGSGPGSSQSVTMRSLNIVNGASDSSGGAMQVLAGSEVTLDSVSVSNSVANGMNADQGGGAIFNAGDLSITGGDFSGNSAPMGSGSGGAILNAGSLSITDATLSGNSSQRAGGAIEAVAGSNTTLDAVTLSENTTGPMPGNGGGMHITGAGDATITNGTVSGNSAAAEGGGLWNGAGTMTVTGTSISGNTASGDDPDNGGGGLFNVAGTLTVSGATISNNIADGVSGSGGGILNQGSLTVTDTSITGNSSNRAGGGIEATDASETTLENVALDDNTTGANPGNGGGMHISGAGNASISGGTVSGNTAAREGGGLWNGAGRMAVDGTTISNNAANGDAADDGGGGLFNNTGRMELTNVVVTNNTASGSAGSGGGVFNLGPDSAMPDRGVLIVSGGEISGNSSTRAGGGVEATPNTETTLQDGLMLSGNTTGDSPGNGGGMHITGAGNATISDVTVSGNTAGREGGGLWNGAGAMTVSNSTIAENIAQGGAANQGGGGLFNLAGTLDVSDTIITGNDASGASGSGGGILNLGNALTVMGGRIAGNTAVRAGGGIEDNNTATEGVGTAMADITLRNLTLDGNSTGPSPGNGGALHVTGGNAVILVDRVTASNNSAANEGGGFWNFNEAEMTLVNSTISGNDAGAGGGGGIFNRPDGALDLLNVTIADNSTLGDGGGLRNDGGLVEAFNVLIATNAAQGMGDEVSGATLESGNNQVGGDPMIGPLAANGGDTQTHALMEGSPAIDAGDDSVCQAMPVDGIDQRGVSRDAPGCDVGAYELVDGPVATTSNNAPEQVAAAPGDTDVVAVAFTIEQPASQGENLEVGGFSGSLSSMGDIEGRLVNARIAIDANADGMLDGSDQVLSASQAAVSLNTAGNAFSVSFADDRVLAPGSSESYLLIVDIAQNSAAAGDWKLMLATGGAGLPLLAAGLFGLPRRRGAMAVLFVVGGLGLSACDGTSPRAIQDDSIAEARFSVEQIDATGAMSGMPAQGLTLPLDGPRIVIDE